MRALALLFLSCASQRYGFPSREFSTVPTIHDVARAPLGSTRAVKSPVAASAAVVNGSSSNFLQGGAGHLWPPWPDPGDVWPPPSTLEVTFSSPAAKFTNLAATYHQNLASGVVAYQKQQLVLLHHGSPRRLHIHFHGLIRSIRSGPTNASATEPTSNYHHHSPTAVPNHPISTPPTPTPIEDDETAE